MVISYSKFVLFESSSWRSRFSNDLLISTSGTTSVANPWVDRFNPEKLQAAIAKPFHVSRQSQLP